MQNVWSVFSTNWWIDNVALYGSTTVSDTYEINLFRIGNYIYRFDEFTKWSTDEFQWYDSISIMHHAHLVHSNPMALSRNLNLIEFMHTYCRTRNILAIVQKWTGIIHTHTRSIGHCAVSMHGWRMGRHIKLLIGIYHFQSLVFIVEKCLSHTAYKYVACVCGKLAKKCETEASSRHDSLWWGCSLVVVVDDVADTCTTIPNQCLLSDAKCVCLCTFHVEGGSYYAQVHITNLTRAKWYCSRVGISMRSQVHGPNMNVRWMARLRCSTVNWMRLTHANDMRNCYLMQINNENTRNLLRWSTWLSVPFAAHIYHHYWVPQRCSVSWIQNEINSYSTVCSSHFPGRFHTRQWFIWMRILLTFGDGITENVDIILSGYSSRIFESKSVPMPEPVPPPNECANWNPCRQSQPSASLRTTSNTESTSSAPSV